MKRNFRSLVIGLLMASHSSGQVELQKVVPLSPNAATIAKYGEVPVGYFTGVPSISYPLCEARSGTISIPLSLSYHAGGNKVEDVASWVGTGWSVNGLPSISRNIRGIADEAANGYFWGYSGKTIKFIYENRSEPTQAQLIKNFFSDVFNGNADTEPDIFNYNIGGKSGKFFYCQETQNFTTYPYENIKISYSFSDNSFTIVDDDGAKYQFPVKEVTTSSVNNSLGQSNVTTWWCNKIADANGCNEVNIEYLVNLEYLRNATSYTKSLYLNGDISCIIGASLGGSSVEQTVNSSQIGSVKPFKITSSTSTIEFEQDIAERADLQGSRTLKRIRVKDQLGVMRKDINFSYGYWTSVYQVGDAYENKRLFLDKYWESNGVETLPAYEFTYNTSTGIPSRVSKAQDHWGFFNGAHQNSDLIPPTFFIYPGSTTESYLDGADRTVNPEKTSFGILEKVKYPTGGTTSFEYENNLANEPTLENRYIPNSVALTGNPSNTSTSITYTKTFTIQAPSDPYLNANKGGAFASIKIGNLGCDLSNGANLCAALTIQGISASNSNVGGTFNSNVDGYYLPNGDYTMTASFYQDPVAFNNFYFSIDWKTIDPNYSLNKLVGGLRVKKIINTDGIPNSPTAIRTFTYETKDPNNNSISSGRSFGIPYFEYKDENIYKASSTMDGAPFCKTCLFSLLKRTSYSTITQISHSGSFLGYEKVQEYLGINGQGGKTEYTFSMASDQGGTNVQFPYPPALTQEVKRGQLLSKEELEYRPNQTETYKTVRKTINIYKSFNEASTMSYGNTQAYALKTGSRVVNVQEQCSTLAYDPGTSVEYAPYNLTTDWMGLGKTTEIIVGRPDVSMTMENITENEYDGQRLLLRNVKQWSSKGGNPIITTNKYPNDIVLTGDAESARQKLIEQNRIKTVLQNIRSKDNVILTTQYNDYRVLSGQKVFPSSISVKQLTAPIEERIRFEKYDPQKGNLLQQRKTGDASTSYIWDHNNTVPIAECINAIADEIAQTSFEADGKGGLAFPGTPTTDATSPTGKRCYSLATGNITKTGLITGKAYVVSYWSKNGAYNVSGTSPVRTGATLSGWTYYEHQVTGDVTISGTGLIDEVRLYPKGAQMTTYTYEPLVGMTSQCDVNNKITYYEYDSFGRLKRMLDEQRNVIKTMDYQYQAPIGN